MTQISPYLFAVHDYHPDWANMVQAAGKSAWAIHTEAIGCNAKDRNGKDYPAGVTNVVRLNNAYGTGGVIPLPNMYNDFAARCANFVEASRNIHYVVIGNEPSLEWDWPDNQPITIGGFIEQCKKAIDAIKNVAPGVKVAAGACAPWNVQMPGAADWITQLTQILTGLGNRIDWIALHAYTRGYDANVFNTGAVMDPPWDHYHSGWEALYDYMRAIPATHKHLPVLITETNGNAPWSADNTGWIQRMYLNLDEWNNTPGNQKILCSALFRWMKDDAQWDISQHGNAVEDFRSALKLDCKHDYVAGARPDRVRIIAEAGLNMRATPSGAGQVLRVLPFGELVILLNSDGDWLKVSIGGQTGWVHSSFVEVA